jgi:hypothetical protein
LKVYTVYQIHHNRRVREPVGVVLEHRKLERGNNFEDLVKLAKILYPPPPDSHIVLLLA